MKILVTGSNGFIGKNLIAELENIKERKVKKFSNFSNLTIYKFDVDTDINKLEVYCKEADFVFHLAGVNRPNDLSEFMDGNFGFTKLLIQHLLKHKNKCPIMLSSSIQAEQNNPYGISKKAGEDLLIEYGHSNGVDILIYRFPNVFGKWCRPNYNSAIATFCHNIANNLPIHINDRKTNITLVYIDDLVQELITNLFSNTIKIKQYYDVPIKYIVTLGEIADLIYSFKESRTNLKIPDFSNQFNKKLYSTYLSYLPQNQFSYLLTMKEDNRGSFSEFIKSSSIGQVSVNISKPGITKGQHWHHTKVEKFLVVSGKGVIRFRKIDSNEIIEYYVSDKVLEVVDIPVGYTHNIENLGNDSMVTIMWTNEIFDENKPDTYLLDV